MPDPGVHQREARLSTLFHLVLVNISVPGPGVRPREVRLSTPARKRLKSWRNAELKETTRLIPDFMVSLEEFSLCDRRSECNVIERKEEKIKWKNNKHALIEYINFKGTLYILCTIRHNKVINKHTSYKIIKGCYFSMHYLHARTLPVLS